jgi:hypothetical protein
MQYAPTVLAMFRGTSPLLNPTASPDVHAAHPTDTIKLMQMVLNQFTQANLKVDGVWGSKTDAAMATAMTMAKPYMSMLGITIPNAV